MTTTCPVNIDDAIRQNHGAGWCFCPTGHAYQYFPNGDSCPICGKEWGVVERIESTDMNAPRYIVTKESNGYALWDRLNKAVVLPVYRSRAEAQRQADKANAA